jgi:hypothetical protein
MIHRFSRGLSLVEILIGLFIFMGISLTFVTFLQSSIREAQFSGEHLTAVVLSQKILEDINEEVTINPYGFETLGISGKSVTPMEIVDGKSVFFSYLEDQGKPWGIIEPQQDGFISSKMTPLYDILKPFTFHPTSERLQASGEGENRNLVSCQVKIGWNVAGRKGKYDNACLYFSPVTPKKTDLGLSVDEAAIDARIPKEFYGKPGKSLLEIAQAAGESVESITALGRIALITNDFMKSDRYTKTMQKIAGLMTQLQALPVEKYEERFSLRSQVAREWYDFAKSAFQVIAYLEPALTEMAKGSGFAKIGVASVNPMTFQTSLYNYKIIYGYFTGSIIQARYYYYSLMEPDISHYNGGKKQLLVLQKVMDLYRICSLIPTRPTGMDEYKKFLLRLDKFSEGRNPYLNRLVKQEIIFLGSKTDWLLKYPNLKVLDSLLTEKMPTILAFVSNKSKEAVLNGAKPASPGK